MTPTHDELVKALQERLRNPMWAHSEAPFESPQLDKDTTVADMASAATLLESDAKRIAEFKMLLIIFSVIGGSLGFSIGELPVSHFPRSSIKQTIAEERCSGYDTEGVFRIGDDRHGLWCSSKALPDPIHLDFLYPYQLGVHCISKGDRVHEVWSESVKGEVKGIWLRTFGARRAYYDCAAK